MCDTRICSACDLAGRDHKCAKIKRIGAEQYHADRGYALAVKKAVKECADDDTASRSDLREAVAVLEDVERRGRRVYADDEYETETITGALREARQKLVNAERTDATANVDRLRDELAAAEAALAAMQAPS